MSEQGNGLNHFHVLLPKFDASGEKLGNRMFIIVLEAVENLLYSCMSAKDETSKSRVSWKRRLYATSLHPHSESQDDSNNTSSIALHPGNTVVFCRLHNFSKILKRVTR